MRGYPARSPRRTLRTVSAAGLAIMIASALVGCGHMGTSRSTPLETVARVDLDRYLGTWYEIARYPHRFQEDCVASTATYARLADGRIRVENACRDASRDDEVRRVTGVAWVASGDSSNAKLEVQFFWPFRGAYWIIDLDPDYRYAVVGHPSREYLWILSRTPSMDEHVYQRLLRGIAAQGYDLSRIRRTLHPPA